VALTANAGAPALTIAPKSLKLGGVTVGNTSTAKSIALDDKTAVGITVDSTVSSDPGEFAASQSCVKTIGAVSSCAVSVTFKPAAKGNRSATLAITDDAAASPQKIKLSGIGK